MFRHKFICNECDLEVDFMPSSCPRCEFVAEAEVKLEAMENREDYLRLKIFLHNPIINESISQFDLFNKVNRKRKALGINLGND